jgi:hypothetical protein
LEKNYSPLDFILLLAAALTLGRLAFFVGCQLSDPDRVIASLERFIGRVKDNIQRVSVWVLDEGRNMVFFVVFGCGGFLTGNYPWWPFVVFMIWEATYLSALHWAQDRIHRWYNDRVYNARLNAVWALPLNSIDRVVTNNRLYSPPFVIPTHSQLTWTVASALFHLSWNSIKFGITCVIHALMTAAGDLYFIVLEEAFGVSSLSWSLL